MKFGDSYVYHENFWAKFIMHQVLQFGMIMVENTASFCGELIFSQIGEPVLTSFFNQYQYIARQVPSPLKGQELTLADFGFDWRLTNDPVIREGEMDLKMLGGFFYAYGAPCQIEHDAFDFMDHDITSQWVMTESAATCMANAMAESPFGSLNLNETKTNELFNVTDIKTDSSSIAAHIPLFQQKIGPNKPLRTQIGFDHFTVTFGQFDCDVILDYTVKIAVLTDFAKKNNTELFYEEIRFVTSMDLETDNDDIAHIKILEHKMNIDSAFSGKQLPIRNKMKMK